jgi:hypothetical protein
VADSSGLKSVGSWDQPYTKYLEFSPGDQKKGGKKPPIKLIDPNDVYVYVADKSKAKSVKGNDFGDWKYLQILRDAPAPGDFYRCAMTIIFHPTRDRVKATTIAFVQIVKVTNMTYGAREKARVTDGGWSVDRLEGKKYGWYGLEDSGKWDPREVSPGSSPMPYKDAELIDVPGSKTCPAKWYYETFAIAKDGDGGTVLGGLEWGFDANNMGKLQSHPVKFIPKQTPEFLAAITAWNAQAKGPKEKQNTPKGDQVQLGPFK